MDKEKHQLMGYIGPIIIIVCIWLGFHFDGKPAPSDVSPAEDAFSTIRALQHLQHLTSEPHPTGVMANRRVRDYIEKTAAELGFEVDIQKDSITVQGANQVVIVENVIARIKGTTSAQTVMLAAHYDTVHHSPGAGDDGAAVAALLETMRALKAAEPLANDLIFLFTDAEELLLLGARAFVDHHPWAADVDLVMNFEGRGNAGPVQMFQTSPGNSHLVRAYASASPSPIASSLADEVYKYMPNETDFTIFRTIPDIQGLNFAHIGGPANYHSANDRLDLLDEGTLRHHGLQALALARHFGNMDIPAADGSNAIYFNLPGLGLIVYGPTLAMVLALLLLALFVLVFVFGRRAGKLTLTSLALGFAATLTGMVVCIIVPSLLWQGMASAQEPVISFLTGHTYRTETFYLGIFCIALGMSFGIPVLFGKKMNTEGIAVGAALWWLLIALITTFLLPGASYLFALPLFFLLLGMAIVFKNANMAHHKAALIFTLFTVPLLLIYLPILPSLYLAVPLGLVGVAGLLVALAAPYLLVAVTWACGSKRWIVTTLLGISGLIILVAVGTKNKSIDKDHPKFSSILYFADRDSGENRWVSFAPGPDKWTANFLGTEFQFQPQPLLFPSWQRSLCEAQAPDTEATAPTARLVDDRTEGALRHLQLVVHSPRGGHFLGIYPRNRDRSQT